MAKRGAKPKGREVRWSSELAYAVGLMASDGCLSSDGRHLLFVSKDIEQIRNLKKCLGLKAKGENHRPGRKRGVGICYRIQWSDVILYSFLSDVGLTPHKSRTLGPLNIPDAYFFDFLRGSFDGDGSFYSYYDPRWKSSFMYYLSFNSASLAHTLWIRTVLKRLIGVRGHVSRTKPDTQKKNPIASLRYAKKEALVVVRAMYAMPDAPHLSRKKLKIKRTLRIVGKSLLAQSARD